MPESFGKNGFHYEQIARRGQYAIYKQRLRPGVGCLAYEVIRIKEVPEGKMFDKVVEAHEAGPSNEDFGRSGWTFPTLERARQKLAELERIEEKKGRGQKRGHDGEDFSKTPANHV